MATHQIGEPRVRIALGILILPVAAVLAVYPDMLGTVGWILVVAGTVLCISGGISLARNRGYQLPGWLRWITILPVATGILLGIAVVMAGLARVVSSLLPSEALEDVCFSAFLIVATALGASGFVLGGASMAPKRRVGVGVPLAVVYVCCSGYFLFGLVFSLTFGGTGAAWSDVWWFLVPWTSGALAAVSACVHVYRRERGRKGAFDQEEVPRSGPDAGTGPTGRLYA